MLTLDISTKVKTIIHMSPASLLCFVLLQLAVTQAKERPCVESEIGSKCTEEKSKVVHNKCFFNTHLAMNFSQAQKHCKEKHKGTLPLILNKLDLNEMVSTMAIRKAWLNAYSYSHNGVFKWDKCWRNNFTHQEITYNSKKIDTNHSNDLKYECLRIYRRSYLWESELCHNQYNEVICELYWDPTTSITMQGPRPGGTILNDDTLILTCTAFTRKTDGTLTWFVVKKDEKSNHGMFFPEVKRVDKLKSEYVRVKDACFLQLRSKMIFYDRIFREDKSSVSISCFADGIAFAENERMCTISYGSDCAIVNLSKIDTVGNYIGALEVVYDPADIIVSHGPAFYEDKLNFTVKVSLAKINSGDFLWVRSSLHEKTTVLKSHDSRLAHAKIEAEKDVWVITSSLTVKMGPSELGTSFIVFAYDPAKYNNKDLKCNPLDRFCHTFIPISEPPKAIARVNVSYQRFPKPAFYGSIITFTCNITAEEGQMGKLAWVTYFPYKTEMLSRKDERIKTFPKNFTIMGELKSTLEIVMHQSLDGFSVACFGYEPPMFRENITCNDTNPYCEQTSKILGVLQPKEDEGFILKIFKGILSFLLILSICIILYYVLPEGKMVVSEESSDVEDREEANDDVDKKSARSLERTSQTISEKSTNAGISSSVDDQFQAKRNSGSKSGSLEGSSIRSSSKSGEFKLPKRATLKSRDMNSPNDEDQKP